MTLKEAIAIAEVVRDQFMKDPKSRERVVVGDALVVLYAELKRLETRLRLISPNHTYDGINEPRTS